MTNKKSALTAATVQSTSTIEHNQDNTIEATNQGGANLRFIEFHKAESKGVRTFKHSLSELKNSLNLVDRAGMAIGCQNLSYSVVMDVLALLQSLLKEEVRESIPDVPFERYEDYLQRVSGSKKMHFDTASEKGVNQL